MKRDLEKIPENFRQVTVVTESPFFSILLENFLSRSKIVKTLHTQKTNQLLFDEISDRNGFVFVHETSLLRMTHKLNESRPSNIPQKISQNSPLIIFSNESHRSWPTHKFPYFGLNGSQITSKDCLKIDALMFDILEQHGLLQIDRKINSTDNTSPTAKENAQILRQIAAELRDMRLNSTTEIIQNIEKIAEDVESLGEADPSMSRVQNIIVSAMEVLAGKTGGKLVVIAIATSLFTAIGANSNLALGLSAAVMLGPDAVKQFFKDIKKNLEKGGATD